MTTANDAGGPSPVAYMRVRPFLAMSAWSRSRLYRVHGPRWPLLRKLDRTTVVDLAVWREFMRACPPVTRR